MHQTNLDLLRVLVVDNYDSFTYNLVDLLRALGISQLDIALNNQLNWQQVDLYQKILISPGPGTPQEAGDILELVHRFKKTKSILGICLGHQAIAQGFGAKLINIPNPRHGQAVSINLSAEDSLFKGLPDKITGGLYHSWSVDASSLPEELSVTATSGERIMAIRHQMYDIAGVQFHPESYATPRGIDILRNWVFS